MASASGLLHLRKDEAGDPNLYHGTPPGMEGHPLFTKGGGSVGLITAQAPRFPTSGINSNEDLERHFASKGLKFEKTHGDYGGPEESYIVHGATREQLYHAAHAAGQEAAVHSQDGKHELLYTHGPNIGKFHPSLPITGFSKEQPDGYYTHIPGRGHVSLHFDADRLQDSPILHTIPVSQHGPAGEVAQPQVSKSEVRATILRALTKALAEDGPLKWDGAAPWHEAHSSYHKKSIGHGVLLDTKGFTDLLPLAKSERAPQSLVKADAAVSDDIAVSDFPKHSTPFGKIDRASTPNLRFYKMAGKAGAADQLVKDHGFSTYYHGGKQGRADHHGKNTDTGHLPIHDPSGGTDDGTGHGDAWRKTRALAFALTMPDVNKLYGEGRRNGGLGKRSVREAKRAVHWASLSADKHHELLKQIGVNSSEEDHQKERNTAMADAVHRAITGKTNDPVAEGFTPHSHHVPVETALGMIDDHASSMKKSETISPLIVTANLLSAVLDILKKRHS